MSSDYQLKPCPFCGCEAEIRQKGNNHTSKRSVTIRCKGCRFQRTDGAIRYGMDWLVEVASRAWNTRACPWRPIETAPYDQMVLMRTASGQIHEDFVYDSSPDWHKSRGVTHWMPLPTPPEESA